MQQNWIIDCWNPKDRFHTHSIESKTLLCKMHLKIMSAEFLYQKANKLFKMQLYRAYPLLPYRVRLSNSWWRHQMETFSTLLAIYAVCGEFTGHQRIPTQRPVTRSVDVFFDLRPNKRLSKQSWGWWFETQSRPFWRHCNDWPMSRVHVLLYVKSSWTWYQSNICRCSVNVHVIFSK